MQKFNLPLADATKLPLAASCLAVLVIRCIYVFKYPNLAGDTPIYISIAECINNGFGFSYPDANICQPLIGGYFPLYPYMLAFLKNILHSNKSIAVLFSIFNSLSISILGLVCLSITKRTIFSVLVVLSLGLSPLGLGMSRYLLIEPVIISFGILILSTIIARHYGLISRISFFIISVVLFSLSLYLKPTSLIFVFPILYVLTKGLKIKAALYHSFLFLFICFLMVLPWLLRSVALNSGFDLIRGVSSLHPENISSYHKWLSTWVITEYERANAIFPLWTDPTMISIRPNIFLSSSSAEQALDILAQPNSEPIGLSIEQSMYFANEYEKIRESTNVLKTILQKVLQALSLFLHPANSWGFPIEISDSSSSVSGSFLQIIKMNISSIIGKFGVFLYRFTIFFIDLVIVPIYLWNNRLHKSNGFNFFEFSKFIWIIFMLIFMASLISYVNFVTLEHRFLLIITPWCDLIAMTFLWTFFTCRSRINLDRV